MLEKFLKTLDLSQKEANIYLALLKIGQNPASTIAKFTKLSRTTVYSCLQTLVEKQFVQFYQKNKLQIFAARPPETIQIILERKIREANIRRKKFESLLPNFKALINSGQILPSVEYFEGLEGIKKIYNHHLEQKTEKLSYSPAHAIKDPELRKFLDIYIAKRTALKLQARVIFPINKDTQNIQLKDDKTFRRSALVPEEMFPFSAEVNIYGNYVSYISLAGNYHGVILESSEIAQTQKSIFELSWIAAQTFVKTQ
jgi:sugar-specific transcriptional regulator TrmB